MTDTCSLCGHLKSEHMQESRVSLYAEGSRELCLECPGYETPGYPTGKAWHRFRGEEK